MDVHRNLKTYIEENHKSIEDFTGVANWRELWEKAENKDFGLFFLDIFVGQMKSLGFHHTNADDAVPIHLRGKQLLYHLILFSKNELGAKFWKEAKKYSTDQLELL